MIRNAKNTLAMAVLLTLAGGAFAQQALKVEDAIKYRKAAYSTMSWTMGTIKANLEGNFNKARVQQAANTLAALANSGMGSLYVPGSAGGSSKLHPDFSKNQQNLAMLAQDFSRAADALVKVAETGDVAAIKDQHGKVGAICKACHDDFRVK